MPPIQRRLSPSGGTATTRIPVYSLSGGVSTQPSTKRLPLEAEALDNALISLERSFEKRPGFEIIPQESFIGNNQINNQNRLDLYRLYGNDSIDIYWSWFTINEDNRFLIGIDYNAKSENSILFYVYKLNENTWVDITPTSNIEQTEQDSTIVSPTTRNYITYNINSSYKSKDVLKITTVGSSLIVLNTLVKAGFTSGKNGYTINLDGSETTTKDLKGQKVTYYTSSIVMGSTGNLETLTTSTDVSKQGSDYFYYSSTGVAISALTELTLGINIDDRVVVGGNITMHPSGINNSPPTTYIQDAYLTGNIKEVYNNTVDNLSFSNTPTNFKTTTTNVYLAGSTTNPTLSSVLNQVIVIEPAAIPTDITGGYFTNTGILIWVSNEEWVYGYITNYTAAAGLTPARITLKVSAVSPTWKNSSSQFPAGTKNIAFECLTLNLTTFSPTLSTSGTTYTTWLIWYGTYLPVEDFKYKDPDKPWFGQSFSDFSEIRFPTEPNEVFANNSWLAGKSTTAIDQTARDMIIALYDSEHPLISQINATGIYTSTGFGLGKILYTSGPYLTQSSGYYRVINFPETQKYTLVKDLGNNTFQNYTINGTGRPYTQKIRSPDICSVIDETRMPQKLSFDASPEGINKDWYFGPIKWKERTNGDRNTNPGPSVFLTSDKTEARHINLNAITTYRDRLYFSSGDVVFSTQLGNYEDLFLQDPSNIVSSDPIDIRASSKSYAEITSLTPFSDFLFINTKADIQFELRGSENQITPLTAQITPTAFYSTAKLTEPLLMGSLIYFFDKSRLYMYTAQQTASLSTAEEISSHCSGYLPKNYRAPCIAPAHNSIIFIDDDKPNYIYLYTNKFSADRVLQNAFYRYNLVDEFDEILTTQVYDNYLVCVVKKNNQYSSLNSTNIGISEYYILKSYLGKQHISIPRLDNLFSFTIYENNNTVYNSDTNETVFTINFPYAPISPEKLLIITDPNDSAWGEKKYTILKPTFAYLPGFGIKLSVKGNYLNQLGRLYIGTSYTMNVELSTPFVRDQNNNAIDGVLNLKTLVLRHADTGNYDIVATRREKSILKSTFSALQSNKIVDTLSIENTEKNGEFVAKILGFSDSTTIKITSDYPTPVNIVNMEFKGKFKQTNTSLGT
jgi:hypothetical protein